MRSLLTVEDFRRRAQRLLPKAVFDYVDGGAESEVTMRANRQAFEEVTLRPHGAVQLPSIDIGTTLLGWRLALPVLLAPCGMARLVHPEGDVAAAGAAGRAGTIFVQSTMSGHCMQDVVAAAQGSPVWYQVYDVAGDESVRQSVARARDAGVAGLVVTIDTAVGSLRVRDQRHGGLALLSGNPVRALAQIPDLLESPGWLVRQARRGAIPQLMNVPAPDGSPYRLGRSPMPRSLTWADLTWVRQVFDGPVVVKGVLTAADARRSVDEGAAAVIVSNHGGRQLDGVDASLRALPEVVDAVGDACPVLLDSGVRTSIDVLKALGLGARAVLVGRPWLYGLGVAGERGVTSVLRLFEEGIRRNLALMGRSRLDELQPGDIRVPLSWQAGSGT